MRMTQSGLLPKLGVRAICSASPNRRLRANATHIHSGCAQQRQYPNELGIGKLTLRILARKQQVHQIVIAQFEKARNCTHVGVAEVMLIFSEETLE